MYGMRGQGAMVSAVEEVEEAEGIVGYEEDPGNMSCVLCFLLWCCRILSSRVRLALQSITVWTCNWYASPRPHGDVCLLISASGTEHRLQCLDPVRSARSDNVDGCGTIQAKLATRRDEGNDNNSRADADVPAVDLRPSIS